MVRKTTNEPSIMDLYSNMFIPLGKMTYGTEFFFPVSFIIFVFVSPFPSSSSFLLPFHSFVILSALSAASEAFSVTCEALSAAFEALSAASEALSASSEALPAASETLSVSNVL